eukprot:scaffold154875_cov30-Tisochrysis_lutea.AAC.2
MLRKSQEALLPEQRRHGGFITEANEVLNEPVDNAIGQCVLLEEERSEEECVGATKLDLGELENGNRRVEHGDGHLGQD